MTTPEEMAAFASSQVNSDSAELIVCRLTPSGSGVFTYVSDTHRFLVQVSITLDLERYEAYAFDSGPTMTAEQWLQSPLGFEFQERIQATHLDTDDIFGMQFN